VPKGARPAGRPDEGRLPLEWGTFCFDDSDSVSGRLLSSYASGLNGKATCCSLPTERGDIHQRGHDENDLNRLGYRR
jgi:hypothetical protein